MGEVDWTILHTLRRQLIMERHAALQAVLEGPPAATPCALEGYPPVEDPSGRLCRVDLLLSVLDGLTDIPAGSPTRELGVLLLQLAAELPRLPAPAARAYIEAIEGARDIPLRAELWHR
ncbi:MAG: hypothetical protein JNM72_21735 [Deltaproteobacteria bacterium]|jgi:hypothetical protein|nr:hypothetical protein [Deltaproteobacteria bacterium]